MYMRAPDMEGLILKTLVHISSLIQCMAVYFSSKNIYLWNLGGGATGRAYMLHCKWTWIQVSLRCKREKSHPLPIYLLFLPQLLFLSK